MLKHTMERNRVETSILGILFSCLINVIWQLNVNNLVTNFIQLASLQPVNQFSQTLLHWKAPNEGYLTIYGM